MIPERENDPAAPELEEGRDAGDGGGNRRSGVVLLLVVTHKVVMGAKRRRLDRVAPEPREPGR